MKYAITTHIIGMFDALRMMSGTNRACKGEGIWCWCVTDRGWVGGEVILHYITSK